MIVIEWKEGTFISNNIDITQWLPAHHQIWSWNEFSAFSHLLMMYTYQRLTHQYLKSKSHPGITILFLSLLFQSLCVFFLLCWIMKWATVFNYLTKLLKVWRNPQYETLHCNDLQISALIIFSFLRFLPTSGLVSHN